MRPSSSLVPDHFVLMGAKVGERTLRPVHGQTQAFAGALAVGRILGALVEGHADVGAESDLHIHGVFGREEVAAAVEVRAEVDALVGDFAQLSQAVDLEAAGVGEHGARPADEAVQAAHAADGFVARAEVEMVGVAEDDLCAEGFERVLRNGFDRACGADGHEDRGFDGLVGQMDLRATSAGRCRMKEVEREAHWTILSVAVAGRTVDDAAGSPLRTPCWDESYPMRLCWARKMRREAMFWR